MTYLWTKVIYTIKNDFIKYLRLTNYINYIKNNKVLK